MRILITISALCLASAASAHAQGPSPRLVTSAPASRGASQLALKERMGQRQLDMLVDSIVREGEAPQKLATRADQAYASNQR